MARSWSGWKRSATLTTGVETTKEIYRMSKNIGGKVFVVTGGSSGLGEATARHLAHEGATVVLGTGTASLNS